KIVRVYGFVSHLPSIRYHLLMFIIDKKILEKMSRRPRSPCLRSFLSDKVNRPFLIKLCQDGATSRFRLLRRGIRQGAWRRSQRSEQFVERGLAVAPFQYIV